MQGVFTRSGRYTYAAHSRRLSKSDVFSLGETVRLVIYSSGSRVQRSSGFQCIGVRGANLSQSVDSLLKSRLKDLNNSLRDYQDYLCTGTCVHVCAQTKKPVDFVDSRHHEVLYEMSQQLFRLTNFTFHVATIPLSYV